MKHVVYTRHGNPLEVLEVREEPVAAPGPGEVRVSRILAPVNPADLNAVEGNYPTRSEPPAVPGVEGVGVVEAVGRAVSRFKVGERVLFPHGYGTWREGGILPAQGLTPVPEGVPWREAAMLKINPATAWRMLHDFVDLPAGSWVAQNAANSAVGRHVIAIARELGLRTVNVVRRAELVAELEAAGGDWVLTEEEATPERVREATGKAPVPLAFNAVGGESAERLSALLASGGTLVTYGAMSRRPVRLPAGRLIFKDLRFRGFWVSRWYESAPADAREAMFERLFDFARRGIVQTPVERVYPVADALQAVARAQEGGRGGKILLGHDAE